AHWSRRIPARASAAHSSARAARFATPCPPHAPRPGILPAGSSARRHPSRRDHGSDDSIPAMIESGRRERQSGFFEWRDLLVPTSASGDWNIAIADGPVVATAIHDGHLIRPSLAPSLALSDAN